MESVKSINALLLKARKYILDHGYSPEYRYTYHWIWKKFSKYAKEKKLSAYSADLGMEFYCNWLGYNSEAATEKKDDYKLRAIKVLDDIFHDRPLKRKYSHKKIYIPASYLSEYNAYLKYLTENGQKPRTIETKMSRLLVFLRFLDKEGDTLSILDFHAVERFIRHISISYSRTTQANIKFTVRNFLRFSSLIPSFKVLYVI